MSAPDKILELVERFRDHQDAYRSGHYNETQVRRDFIDPMFRELGWDVDNREGYAEQYREVIHEDAIKIGKTTKAPDYCFRIGGQRKFFVEAKKPSVNLDHDMAAAFQVRRYAWTAKLSLSVLTDFEEFAVYDARIRPSKTDKAAKARTLYLTFDQYPEKWDEIAGIFHKKSILKGSFDRYVEDKKIKKGTATVDDSFLEDMESWRDALARNLALRNPGLSQRELNFAVQRIIDRIVFLRICEDRGIEPYGQLQLIQKKKDIYRKELIPIFHRADQKYNSGLFHFADERGRPTEPDKLTLDLSLDDKTLQAMLGRLYYPESPYEFSVMPAEILGHVYERFLGSVIRLTGNHRAKVEQKPEVRKAGGVYYTPSYIVDTIVKQTVGKLLHGKKPKDVEALKLCDISCGSGSFLIGAYQFLLDWYRDSYLQSKSKKDKKLIVQDMSGEWRLTTDERKRILLAHIYGVDIDPQAVETTKLSLLLKVLEGENEESLKKQMELFKTRALPDLGENIKCGNSLIGTDFYQGEQLELLDEETQYRVNAFDWHDEFPDVFKRRNPGFDAIIGNPPYIRIQNIKEWAPIEVEFYKKRYESAQKGNYDIYVVFSEKGLSLLNEQGLLGYIMPHKFFNAKYGVGIRNIIAQGKHLSQVVHFGDKQVFHDATTYTCLFFMGRTAQKTFTMQKVDDLDQWQIDGTCRSGEVPTDKLTPSEWNFVIGKGAGLFDRLSEMPVKLGDVAAKIAQGIRTSKNEVYVLDMKKELPETIQGYSKQLNDIVEIERALCSLFLQGREIKPYRVLHSGKTVVIPYRLSGSKASFIQEDELGHSYPLLYRYLFKNKSVLEGREKGRMRCPEWYAYIYPKNIEVMKSPKILVPDIADKAAFTLDENGDYAFTSGYGIVLKENTELDMKYVLGLLNSKVLDFFLKKISTTLRGGFFRYFTQYISQLPIRPIDFNDPADKARHDKMVSLVQTMLDLNKRLQAARTHDETKLLQRRITATDRAIDTLVYELYGLTAEETALVEGSA